MFKIIYTSHALEQMADRKISKFLVELAVAEGDSLEKYRSDAWRLKKVLPNGDNMVVGFAAEGNKMIIATVFIQEKKGQ